MEQQVGFLALLDFRSAEELVCTTYEKAMEGFLGERRKVANLVPLKTFFGSWLGVSIRGTGPTACGDPFVLVWVIFA